MKRLDWGKSSLLSVKLMLFALLKNGVIVDVGL